MKEYLLFIRDGENPSIDPVANPAEWQTHMEDWKKWLEQLVREDRFISGNPLVDENSVISGEKKLIIDGPFIESKELIVGYLIIKAGNRGEAVQVALACPALTVNGTVEVREIKEMSLLDKH